jgi:Tfp pilus assembly protein PilX
VIRLRHHRRDEEGFALIAVLGAMTVITLFLLATLAYAMASTGPSRRDQDAKASLAAAQSGVDEFLARLNANDTYWTNDGNDCSNLALVAPASATPCAKPAAGIAVPGAADAGTTYKYKLLSTTTETASSGFIRLQATGTSRGVSRDLTVRLSPVGFLRFIYFTDVEAVDPALYRSSARGVARRVSDGALFTTTVAAAQADTDCVQHYYDDPVSGADGRANARFRTSYSGVLYDVYGYCSEIQFTDGDKILGPLKTNDALQINGSALFTTTEPETGWADGSSPAPTVGKRWWGSGTPSAGTGTGAGKGYRPEFGATLQIPESNAELIRAADRSAGGVGCVYTGETSIKFESNKMKVMSPGTTTSTTGCWNAANRSAEQTLDIPPVIYVRDATTCGPVRVGYPRVGEATDKGTTTDYSCTNGNAYVQGVLNGRTTIGTENDIVLTGNTTYSDQRKDSAGNLVGDDVLGLIPQNYAWVYHPVKSDGNNLLPDAEAVRKIDAAVLSVKHSFLVQNWNLGATLSPGTDDTKKLQVNGAIAQKFRGPVGTGSGSGSATGYLKAYTYDTRLLAAPPPYFLKPVTSPWAVTKVTD